MRKVAVKNLICLLLLPLSGFGQVPLTTAQIAKKVSPSVVVIAGKTDSGSVLGSGFIVSKDGKIATNLHVIREMKTATVQLANGEVYDSLSVLATDERRDLAIVWVAGFNLPVLDLGNSDALTVGEPIVMVGSPKGLEGTVTAGILSSIRDSGDGYKVLQTDAAMNPGNSGGPFVNNKGQAIGVASFKLRSTEGLNFAIPINYVRGLLKNVQEPITLSQMRKSLTSEPTKASSSGLSLDQTLDWLKKNIPQRSIDYVVEWQATDGSHAKVKVSSQSMAWSLTSCRITIGNVSDPSPSSGTMTRTHQYTLDLGQIVNVDVQRSYNANMAGMTITSGEEWGYHVLLRTKAKTIIARATLPGPDGKLYSFEDLTDNFYTVFSDEAVARRISDMFIHAADLCRESAGTPDTVGFSSTGPSLQETLDWLKEKIRLAANYYVLPALGPFPAKTVTVRTVPTHFDSCTVSFDLIEMEVWANFPDVPIVTTTHDTFPLGAISFGEVRKRSMSVQSTASKIDRQLDEWDVILNATTNAVLWETNEDLKNTTKSESAKFAVLSFYEESIANRVLEAFLHGAVLCRGKEPF
jgi:S1-C subfamily serine protease